MENMSKVNFLVQFQLFIWWLAMEVSYALIGTSVRRYVKFWIIDDTYCLILTLANESFSACSVGHYYIYTTSTQKICYEMIEIRLLV